MASWQRRADSFRGPFKQSSEGMHSLRRAVETRSKDLSELLFWSAVCFTNTSFDMPVAPGMARLAGNRSNLALGPQPRFVCHRRVSSRTQTHG